MLAFSAYFNNADNAIENIFKALQYGRIDHSASGTEEM